ncbi:hydroxyneurosporene-O-methyltransferase [Mycobacterium bourgelatii]|uniref:Hydroxyneurosporene-O-methyltransferase n=1 Tax=Mycobacterium bourgelatii TaxID=1273442 RepID=A0A7I9YMA8_MYCBU|nr:acetylserotonin O-methyltransferase [Mycobacterium bourgelatii]GFG89814.1 hydroxyneurosporene-O-methyltransferase [Mycobacterium bourgelatii]
MNAWAAQAISAAVALGIADALADAPLRLDELAPRVNADPDALRRLLRALIGRGVFRQRRDGRYELNPLADTLRSSAPLSAAGLARMVGSPQHREVWSHLADAIRTGGAVFPAVHGTDAFDYLSREPELAEGFNRAMAETTAMAVPALMAAYSFDPYRTVADVGGGEGELLAAILSATPTARGILYDLPYAVVEAQSLLRQHGIADRVRVVAGSFFDSVPAGADIYVLKNVIHDWPDERAVEILRNIRAAAKIGTKILLIEFVIPHHNREYIGHLTDLEMLVTQAGRDRTAAEYRTLLERAGFRVTRVVPTASPFSIVEAILDDNVV